MILKIKNNKYIQLLFYLISFFLLFPLSQYILIINFLFPLGFFLIIISAINTLNISKKIIKFYWILAILSLVSNLIDLYYQSYWTESITIFTDIFDCLFLILSIIAIYKKIHEENKVNNNVIAGAISVYIMLGLLWFLFYKIIYFFDINAFNFPDINNKSVSIYLFYFSFITLTTVGYGDITPVNQFAMLLSNLEALCGQLFLAISIAILVSLYKRNSEEN